MSSTIKPLEDAIKKIRSEIESNRNKMKASKDALEISTLKLESTQAQLKVLRLENPSTVPSEEEQELVFKVQQFEFDCEIAALRVEKCQIGEKALELKIKQHTSLLEYEQQKIMDSTPSPCPPVKKQENWVANAIEFLNGSSLSQRLFLINQALADKYEVPDGPDKREICQTLMFVRACFNTIDKYGPRSLMSKPCHHGSKCYNARCAFEHEGRDEFKALLSSLFGVNFKAQTSDEFLDAMRDKRRQIISHAATVIQASFRGKHDRKQMNDEIHASVVIQAAFRGYLVRKNRMTTYADVVKKPIDTADAVKPDFSWGNDEHVH